MNKIFAPFTDIQIDNINSFQRNAPIHPFTCGNNDMYHTNGGILDALKEGMICNQCGYKQNWVYEYMCETHSKINFVSLLIRKFKLNKIIKNI